MKNKTQENKTHMKYFLLLHGILFLYSLGGIANKMAAREEIFSAGWCIFYGMALLNLFVYALLWQQILKKMPLTTAFANKSIVIVWSMIWGSLFFHETVTIKQMVGCAFVFFGVYLVVMNDGA